MMRRISKRDFLATNVPNKTAHSSYHGIGQFLNAKKLTKRNEHKRKYMSTKPGKAIPPIVSQGEWEAARKKYSRKRKR